MSITLVKSLMPASFEFKERLRNSGRFVDFSYDKDFMDEIIMGNTRISFTK